MASLTHSRETVVEVVRVEWVEHELMVTKFTSSFLMHMVARQAMEPKADEYQLAMDRLVSD